MTLQRTICVTFESGHVLDVRSVRLFESGHSSDMQVFWFLNSNMILVSLIRFDKCHANLVSNTYPIWMRHSF